MKEIVFDQMIRDEAEMLAMGGKVANVCNDDGLVFFLYGPLGAGKTTLVRGFLRGLGYQGKVKSPTYTLVESYELTKRYVYHFDFYRLRDPAELDFMGIQDYFSYEAICMIEWPDCGEGFLPSADVSCYIEMDSDRRYLKLIAHTSIGISIVERMQREK